MHKILYTLMLTGLFLMATEAGAMDEAGAAIIRAEVNARITAAQYLKAQRDAQLKQVLDACLKAHQEIERIRGMAQTDYFHQKEDLTTVVAKVGEATARLKEVKDKWEER